VLSLCVPWHALIVGIFGVCVVFIFSCCKVVVCCESALFVRVRMCNVKMYRLGDKVECSRTSLLEGDMGSIGEVSRIAVVLYISFCVLLVEEVMG
jgi:hypothetical protein